ncbi:MAG: hypothetical protein EU541_06145 [Promethearchaeota archaeon]|nr:MAG: hypothetical protein EU541_06145 [Candidatus Lokiarchaeota archaeon]
MVILILFLIPVVFLVPTLLLLFHFVKKAITQKKKIFFYLSCLFFIYLLMHFFEASQGFSRTSIGAEFTFIMAQILRMMMLYVLVMVLEFYSQNISFSGKQTILAMLAFIAIGGMISSPNLEVEMIDTSYIVTFTHLSPVVISSLLFNLFASIWLIIMLRRSIKAANTREQKTIISLLILGFIFAIFIPIIPNLIQSLVVPEEARNALFDLIFGSILQNAGILLIGITFYRISNNPWLLQQQKIYLIVVYSHDGVELFSKSFSEEITPNDLMLLAGGFSAISSMFQEITDAEGIIKAILLEDKELRIIKKENFISALLVDYSTEATEEAHKSFANEFETQYKPQLEHFTGEITQFGSAKKIIDQYFF